MNVNYAGGSQIIHSPYSANTGDRSGIEEQYIALLKDRLGFQEIAVAYENSDELETLRSWETPKKQILYSRYHGLGHSQLICQDTTRNHKPFFIGRLGGSNWTDAERSMNEFERLNEEGGEIPDFFDGKELVRYCLYTKELHYYADRKEALKHYSVRQLSQELQRAKKT